MLGISLLQYVHQQAKAGWADKPGSMDASRAWMTSIPGTSFKSICLEPIYILLFYRSFHENRLICIQYDTFRGLFSIQTNLT